MFTWHLGSQYLYDLKFLRQGAVKKIYNGACVNTVGQRPYWLSLWMRVIVLSDLIQLFCLICADYWYHMIHRVTLCMGDLSPCEKGYSLLLFGLSCEKIQRCNNSPFVMGRWPSQQIPPLKFLGLDRNMEGKI